MGQPQRRIWCKILISNYSDVNEKNLYPYHHVIKRVRVLSTDKLSSMEIYSILILNIINKPTSNIYFKIFFENTPLLILPCVLSKIKFLKRCSFSVKDDTIFK